MNYYYVAFLNRNTLVYATYTVYNKLAICTGNRDENDPGWDLAILKSCDHLILTYGTFTTTAGYFSEGKS